MNSIINKLDKYGVASNWNMLMTERTTSMLMTGGNNKRAGLYPAVESAVNDLNLYNEEGNVSFLVSSISY